MNIGIDVDGVLVDLESYQLKYGKIYFYKAHGKDVVNPKGYDIEEIFDCTHAEREKFWQKYIWRYCLKEAPLKNVPEIISKLHNDGHKIYLITGRAHTAESGITGKLFRWMFRHWLKKNHIYYDDIVFCSEKGSSTDKLDACMEKQIEVMIDDKPENLLALAYQIKVICYPTVWNEDVENDDFIRVRDWDDIYEKIKMIVADISTRTE